MAKEEKDPEMLEYLRGEEQEHEERAAELQRRIERLLVPKDPNDDKNVLVEIRAGTGGEEAALFAGELLEMYRRYAERRGWKTDVLSSSPSELGGFKEVVLEVRGKGAYSRLKNEAGPHRVQRVPVTESGGRIHTSTATVAVLPEAEDVDVQIDPDDLEIDVFRSSGPGDRASTPPTRPSGSPISPAASSWLFRRSDPSVRTGRRRFAISDRGCSSRRRTHANRLRRPRGRPRWERGSGPRRSAPTTFRRTESPITGSTSRSTTCLRSWRRAGSTSWWMRSSSESGPIS